MHISFSANLSFKKFQQHNILTVLSNLFLQTFYTKTALFL